MAVEVVTKSVVSVTDMARMVGLSRARFYQLVRRGTFPAADQDAVSNRPCYCEEKQRQILEARRRNCGVDGRPVLFYARRRDAGQSKARLRPARPKSDHNQYADVIAYLLGAQITMTAAQVEAFVKDELAKGTGGINTTEGIVQTIIERRRQNASGSGGPGTPVGPTER